MVRCEGEHSKEEVVAQGTEWARLLVVPGLAEAEMWRTVLAQEGIVALIQPNDAGVYLGPQSFCHLLVPAPDLERARAITTDDDTSDTPATEE